MTQFNIFSEEPEKIDARAMISAIVGGTFLIFLAGVPGPGIALFIAILYLLISIIKIIKNMIISRKPKQQRFYPLIILGVAILITSILSIYYPYQRRITANGIAQKVITYYQANNHYPEDLGVLGEERSGIFYYGMIETHSKDDQKKRKPYLFYTSFRFFYSLDFLHNCIN